MNFKHRKGYRPLLIDGATVYAWSKDGLCTSEDSGDSFQTMHNLSRSLTSSFGMNTNAISRVSRGGVHDLVKLDSGALVAVAKGGIACTLNGEFEFTHKVTRGSRPLSICKQQNRLYFGEYFSNKSRDYVDIFASEDGVNWSVVHRFRPGTVRHVHGIISDDYRSGLWVLTGDTDSESALWFTDDNFETLRPIIRGSQRARAVSVIPTQNGLIVPMDSPLERNYISLLDLSLNELIMGQEVESSIFFARQIGDVYFASTAAEPSSINNVEDAILYASINGIDWSEIFRGKRDLYSQISVRLFQYPTIAIPRAQDTSYFFGYGRSISGLDNYLIRADIDSIVEAIKSLSS